MKQENGKITALEVESDGERQLIPTKSVILACGGFEASESKRMKNIGEEWKNSVVRGSEYNTGDGIEIVLESGGQKFGEWDGCHAHMTDYNAPRVGDYSKPGDIYKKSSYPLGLIVNTNGERFVDEGADFRNYTYAKYGKETLKQPEQKAFQLYDSQVRSLLRKEYDLEEATCIKADTLEELANEMGVNREAFLETIKAYNKAVQEGNYDPSIKDGKQTLGITPPKSNWALQFNQAPFYAYPVTCGITFTFGAVRVNERGEVLNEEVQPIPGLFAAGEMVGGLFYHNYPGGSGLMSGSVFGKQAGITAATLCFAAESAAGERRGADPQTGGDHRRSRVVGDGVAVDGDADLSEQIFGLGSVEGRVAQIDEDEVDVGAAGEDGDSAFGDVVFGQAAGEFAGAGQGPLLPVDEGVGGGQAEGHGLAGDDVFEGSALLSGEDCGIDLLRDVRVIGEDDAASGAAEGLVRRRRHDVGVRDR